MDSAAPSLVETDSGEPKTGLQGEALSWLHGSCEVSLKQENRLGEKAKAEKAANT